MTLIGDYLVVSLVIHMIRGEILISQHTSSK